ncbi:hypothetical protein SKAU_G00367710 [Synaphobranchus kaupii]|uniref:F-box domain-containing protein n=1 Tax=Synaphobranchus kaupii TaxID=118154 RepID=A0A9Q1EFI7_SYNKA|nr:hypothetical protein SKAU_G00367710 [Synaphobranchus kaupii]
MCQIKKRSLMSSTTDVDDTAKATIQSLPPELLVEILSMLSVRDVIAFGSTCDAFHQLTLIHWTWRRLFRRQSGDWRLRNIRIILNVLKIFTASKKDRERE